MINNYEFKGFFGEAKETLINKPLNMITRRRFLSQDNQITPVAPVKMKNKIKAYNNKTVTIPVNSNPKDNGNNT